MNIEEIKTIIEDHFKIDIKFKTRTPKYIVPRYIYFKLCREETNSNSTEIGKGAGTSRYMVKHGITELKALLLDLPPYKLSYDLLSKRITKKRKEQEYLDNLQVVEEIVDKNEHLRQSEKNVLSVLKNMSDIDISLFIDSRLKPYVNMLKSKKTQEVDNVIGATRNFTMKI
jgi:hypothetical protein